MTPRPAPRPRAWLLLVCLVWLLAGCAGHVARTQEARSALDAQNPEQALALLNEELDVDSAKKLPDSVDDDETLLVLDRSMVLQQLGRYEDSSRDLEFADKRIEVLDLSHDATDDLGRYLYSDDAGPYRAPAYEKLLINTMNMVNYLVRGDLNGARIEARRLAVMQRFISEQQDPAAAFLGAGSYLAGFVFEKSGRPDEALRYYDEALKYGNYRSLEEAILRLSGQSGYNSPRLRAAIQRAQSSPTPAASPDDGELLVVVSYGRVPPKEAKRIPIGLALTYASDALSPTDRARASGLAAQGLVTWVNYPELGRPRGQYAEPEFSLDGKWQQLEGIVAIDRQAHQAWEEAKGAVVASAITRMIARVVAGEGVRRASGGALGVLLSLFTQASLTIADTPDTRSWSMLPARMTMGRVRLRPGTHWVWLGARGQRQRHRVEIKPGGFAVLNHTVLN